MTARETPTVTEYDVREAAKRYGMWFGASQSFALGGGATFAALSVELPGAGGLLILAGSLFCYWRWRRAWKAYRAASDARHAARMKALDDSHEAAMRDLAELQSALVKNVGGVQ